MNGLDAWRDDVGSRVNSDVDYAKNDFNQGKKIFDEALKQSLEVIQQRIEVPSQSSTINGLIVRDRV